MANYFEQKGTTALKLWIYSLAVNNLKEEFHKEKTLRLKETITSFIKLLRCNGSPEEEAYAKALVAQLPAKPRGYVRRGEIGVLEMKSWLIDLALNELEKQPEQNKEKAEQLKQWMDISAFAMMNLHIDVRVAFLKQQKRIKALLAVS